MGDVNGIAKAILPNGDTRDIAVGNGVDVLTLDTLGTDIKATMKVVWARLTKVTRQRDFVIHWRGKDT